MTPASPAPPPAAPPWECPVHPGTWVITGACIACSTGFGAAPPAGGPQEAAAPQAALEALAKALFDEFADVGFWSWEQAGAHYLAKAGRVRERLAPAWGALAAENERLRAALEAAHAAVDSHENAYRRCSNIRTILERALGGDGDDE